MAAAPRSMAESTVFMLVDHIKANIPQALQNIRTDRSDAKVSTEPPRDYFIYEDARGYRPPCVFVIVDEVQMKNEDGPNSIFANVVVRVSIVVEDVTKDMLTIKAWRYQDALYAVLNQAQIVSTAGDIKLVTIVQNMLFSPVFTQNTDKKATVNTFRKEVVLELDVKHWEQP